MPKSNYDKRCVIISQYSHSHIELKQKSLTEPNRAEQIFITKEKIIPLINQLVRAYANWK